MIQLLDTNVVSEIRKIRSGRADAGVAAWLELQDTLALYISVVTVFELQHGALRVARKDAAQGALLREWIDKYVLTGFEHRILPIDLPASLRCAELCSQRPCEVPDAMIAATALEHRMTLVTRNVAHFEPLGVRVLNPWLS